MKNGFTLVEVLVAIAVIALTTVMLLGRKAEVMREASRTRDMRVAWQLASEKMGELSLCTDLFQGALDYTASGDFTDANGNNIYPDFKYELEVTTDSIVIDPNNNNQDAQQAQLAHLKLKIEPTAAKDENDYINLEAFYPVIPPGGAAPGGAIPSSATPGGTPPGVAPPGMPPQGGGVKQ